MRTRLRYLTLLLCILVLLSYNPPALAAAPRPAVLAAQTPRKEHINGVTRLVFTPDGATLASVGRDSTVKLTDVATIQDRRVLTGHENPIRAVAISPDGKTLASAGEDTKAFLWDVATGKLLRELAGHIDFVNSVAFSPDGKTLATGSEDARIILWDVATGKLLRTLLGHAAGVTDVAISPDGTTLASASKDKSIKLWDLATATQRKSLTGHTDVVTSVAFGSHGALLASASKDKTIKLWNVATGVEIRTFRGHAKAVNAIAFSPDGLSLASGSDDNSVELWDVGTGSARKALKLQTKAITTVAFSPDGKTLASGSADETIVLWDVATGQPRGVVGSPASAAPSATISTNQATINRAGLANAAPIGMESLSPAQGPGGPILVITSAGNPFSTYYAEILRNEGFNEFDVVDIASVSATPLASYDVVILGEMPLSSAQVTMFTNWVNAGGNLIAMRPDKQLASLLGLTDASATLANGYLLVDTTQSPGNGIVNQSMQFHGAADRYTLSGATSVATLYSNASTATSNPAVTLRSVGSSGGLAAAFTFDLARSIVYMRQGNPAWTAQERDGFTPIRSDDLFYGAAASDPQLDWIDFSKISIPQADEQQRLLANIIMQINLAKKPLPRFWYLPFGKKAAVLMSGDDHANGGTAGRFDTYIAASPPGCSVANWECIRSTSYIYPNTPLSDAQALSYTNQGFEVALHINTNCADFTPASLETFYVQQLSAWHAAYPSQAAPVTHRQHCLVWSDWLSTAKTELNHGIRFDTSYYYWPPNWIANRPGFFNSTAMPMRLVDADGTMIDVYEAATQMTDESGQTYPFTVDTLLDKAVGSEGYYGVYSVNAHTDSVASAVSDAVVASAKTHGVPVVSSRQVLTWVDARNNSTFGSLSWSGNALSFTITPDANANGLQAMVPTHSANGVLTGITRSGNPVTYTTQSIKGIEYAFLSASAGTYVATYGADTIPPAVSSTSPASGATGVGAGSGVSATFSEALDPATVSTATFELRDASNALVPATVTYNAATRTAALQPSSSLANSTTYTAILKGGTTDPRIKDQAGNALAANFTWSFTTAAGLQCPCTIWSSSATPSTPSANDPDAVELGVKFRSDVNGYITGIRFYKGSGNTGTHIGNLWASGGQNLATATFSGESASGWQQVSFASPVAIAANTTYVASYHTNVGHYAADAAFFSSAGVDNVPLHALRNGVDGANGVYLYSATSAFPTATFNASNYWVDVIFDTTAPPDTTPPTVSATTPTTGATGVAPGTSVSATFSEALDPATVGATTFELRNPSNTVVPATVSYNTTNNTATLTPNAPLANSTTYTALLKGGSTDPRVKDLAGNALAANYTWSFTTAAAQTCPCSIWSPSATPTVAADPDAVPTELGVKFRSDVNGYITGIRFYKSSTNTGTHIGNLWASGGQNLATATFSGESASGWQQVSFASPVAIAANTTYVASYHTNVGHYAADAAFFSSAGVDNVPLHALRNGVDGANGVYLYSATSAFPTATFNASNYWVDVIFDTTAPPDTTPPTVSATTPTTGATGVAPGTSVSATFSEALDPATVGATTFELRNPSNTVVPATVSYNTTNNTATLTPNAPLANSTTYTALLKGGSTDPRVKDLAGNALAANYTWSFTTAEPGPCTTPANPIVAENCLTGNPSSEWDITGVGDASIQGFATDISINRGGTINFKIKTTASSYRLDIYRLGYYGGLGARKVVTIQPSASLPQTQPSCLTNSSTGLIDCGNWAVSASWAVPSNATSGIYIAKPVRTDTGGASHIVFIVRDDASTSDLLFQASDTTWQAYNNYGGNSFYTGGPGVNPSRAYKVSYNRPFNTRVVDGATDWIFNAEYPMLRWLEANGYNISYFTDTDSDRRGALIRNHKVFLSVGHDEYWSGVQRTNVEAARNAGVNLAFFSGNEIFWKTRWENSIDGSATAYRTLVSYKETHANATIDPQDPPVWTGTWRDPRFSPPADGGRPENALSGTIFTVNCCSAAITVPAADGKMRFWRNTSIATLAAGTTATLPAGTLGAEWDEDLDNGFRPAGLFGLSTTTVNVSQRILDYGSTYGSGTATHRLTLYRHSSGALVFGSGTYQWSWGLDSNHDNGSGATDLRMQQATVNLLADMTAQPGSLQAGLAPATASTDTAMPTSTITSPTAGSNLLIGNPVTISGTATDASGGVVGGVEVSVDGSATWHPASGRASWTYTWTPTTSGSAIIKSRATDDSSNLETPSAGVTVTVGSTDTTPPTVTGTTPANGATGVSTGTSVTATFNEAIDPATINGTTFELRDPSNALVAAIVTYNGTNRIATLAPSAPLATFTTYTATVRGGTTDPRVKDLAGNALVADVTWSFITGTGAAPQTLVGETTIQSSLDSNPAGLAEAFQYTASASGTANKLYIYIDSRSSATQVVVGLYSNTVSNNPGSLLTQATISNPTNGAWNAVTLPSANVVSGTQYWIAVLGPTGAGTVKFRDAGSGNGKTQTSAEHNLTSLPATWSPGRTFSDSPMSAYIVQ
jgi:N,N-dimethylformamidase beta subunit-like, C-terminal/Domain of unknown function (DUF4082)/Bacterial Ig-like domain/WD domain, G-beta repeat/Bacterial Ig domain